MQKTAKLIISALSLFYLFNCNSCDEQQLIQIKLISSMSKSIDDYRNIIKILKLQLLKIRQDNSELSHTLGIAAQNETSSFSPKINHYAKASDSFAKNILALLNLAHRCELIGLAPEMIFRIADKKRDKKVSSNSLAEILRRVKLHLSEMEITQLISLISRGNANVQYEEYLQCLSAFQINSEKYPASSSRTYVQLCLLKFSKQAISYGDPDKLYKEMNDKQDLPYLSFENYASFVKRNLKNMEQFQIVAVFVGLDLNSQCQIEKSIFRREIGKAFSVLERGVNVEEEFSAIKEPSEIKEAPKISKQRSQKQAPLKKSQSAKPKQVKKQQKMSDDEANLSEQTGDQGAAKAKKASKKPPPAAAAKEVKLPKGDSVKILGEFKKLGIRITDFMDKLINQQKKSNLVRSFTINDFSEAIKAFNNGATKKKILELFRSLDTEVNGTIDSSELLKLWLRGKQISDSEDVLFRLLYRHLRETQFPQPLQKFQVLGVAQDQPISDQLFANAFKDLELTEEELSYIMATYQIGDLKVKDFSERLKADGKKLSTKQFVKMDKKLYDDFKAILQKINGKRKDGNKTFRKLMRLETGQKSTEEEYWQTIFTDQWACWEYCLETAFKLETFWRDPQFGPTQSDSAGIRSIVGNQSNPPPGLPEESEISWATFQDILAKQKSKERVVFMDGPLSPNDVVQGKLGDCWYVSSLSIIANNEDYLKGKPMGQCRKSQQLSIYGVNPSLFKFFTKYGLYVFKYFKKFQPVYVIVDDLFPIQTNANELIFAKSPGAGQQWVAFLQKSYAKLHHSYSNMISGDIAQGLNDLTNALPIKEAIEQGKPQNEEKIRRLNNEQQMMGCSITAPKGARVEAPVTLDDEKCGLFYSHAYSILEFLDLQAKKQVYNLIRVRNPWGHGEWVLDWSDKPKDDNEEYKSLLNNADELKKYYDKKIEQASKIKGRPKPIPYRVGEEDGEFLMKFQDFNKVFTNLFTGYNLPDKYKCLTINQRWDPEFPSGICSLQKATPQEKKQFVKDNHQYLLTVKEDDTDVLMYIVQEDGRLYRGEKYPYKELCNGTLILSFNLADKDKSLEEFDINKSTIKSLKFQLRRQVNMWYKFKAGKYAIIPCKMKNDIETSEFEFRIYFDKDVKIEKIKGHKNTFTPLSEIKTKEIDNGSYTTFLDLLEKYNK